VTDQRANRGASNRRAGPGPGNLWRSARAADTLTHMGSSFGTLFRITTWGESHGPGLGVVVEGCPPRMPLEARDVQSELDRRRPGQSRITTQRREADAVEILSGVYQGLTLGTPIAMAVANSDARGSDYSELQRAYRPSHADYTYQAKYGIRAVEGGGRASARETVGRVAAGAVARRVLLGAGIEVVAWVEQVHGLAASLEVNPDTVTRDEVDETIVRCPDLAAAARMIDAIDSARKAGDSLGGVVAAVARGVPPGLGEPVFDKLEADLGKAMLSIPAAKGFESGSGFAGAIGATGSSHNDLFYSDERGRIRTRTNRSGGIQGGISNGEPITIRVAFKPTATILREQETVTEEGEATVLKPKGRHDPCVLPRAVPIVEAMMCLVLCDHLLRHRAQCGL
jgi:chorismate synthase